MTFRWLKPTRKQGIAAMVLAIALLFINDSFFFESIYVPSTSMVPAVLPNERWIVRKFALGNLSVGDVIVFKSPKDGARLIKRIASITHSPGGGETQFYVLGDNAADSFDSRFFGPVPGANVSAKALFCWYSFDSASHRMRFQRIGETPK